MKIRSKKLAVQARTSILYVRVSTEDQVTEGVSLPDQEARLRAYSAAMGWDDVRVVIDAGESAKSLQRPGIEAVLELVKTGHVSRIVVAKLDRLTRSVRDLGTLLEIVAEHNVALVSVAETLDTSSAAGRMVVNMLGVVAQWEREAIAERTTAALRHKRSLRKVYGPTPFGYRREGDRLVEDGSEQQTLRDMRRLDEGGASYREIVAWLTGHNIQPRRGVTWYASTVRSVLRSRIANELAA